MKQTILFLSQRVYEFYTPQVLETFSQSYRLIAILDDMHIKNFPDNIRPYFANIYVITQTKADSFLKAFVLDKNKVFAIVAEELSLLDSSKQMHLVCIDEFNLELAGELRDHFHIPGAGLSEYHVYRDKRDMKAKVLASHLNAPKYVSFDQNAAKHNPHQYYQYLVDAVGPIMIIKPCDGIGSFHTIKVDSQANFLANLDALCALDISLEVETFISGKMYHCDSIVYQGKILRTFVGEYTVPNMEFILGHPVGSIPLQDQDPLCQRLQHYADQCLHALGLIDGLTHTELFVTESNDIVFIESAARVPGAYIVLNYLHTYGINMMDIDLCIQSGQELVMPMPVKPNQYHLFAFYPIQAGKIIACHDKPGFRSQYQLKWYVKTGDIIPHASKNLVERSVDLFMQHQDYATLYADFQKLKAYQPLDITIP